MNKTPQCEVLYKYRKETKRYLPMLQKSPICTTQGLFCAAQFALIPRAKVTSGDSHIPLLWKNDPNIYQLCSSIFPYVAMITAYDKVFERILVLLVKVDK